MDSVKNFLFFHLEKNSPKLKSSNFKKTNIFLRGRQFFRKTGIVHAFFSKFGTTRRETKKIKRATGRFHVTKH